ncbi:MAG TPA: hypothetical protein VK994_07385, partial [Bacteroidales bacterium]|nr:hypothetical protein [Bacteroidales bacterium]
MKLYRIMIILLLCLPMISLSQSLDYNTGNGIGINVITTSQGKKIKLKDIPLFSFEVNEVKFMSTDAKTAMIGGLTMLIFDKDLAVTFKREGEMLASITFINKGRDTISIENVVPFGALADHTYITGEGPWSLTRAKLFRPGLGPVNVILPDNAWELGYGSFEINDELSISGLCRRKEVNEGQKQRYKTLVYPDGSLSYAFHFETYTGEWQNGLRKIFREKYLYDLDAFDNKLFDRKDLAWIRDACVIGLNFAWDREFYDGEYDVYTLRDYIEFGEQVFGGYDVYSLWPTWPRLGLDERNQFDLFRDLPGGLPTLRKIVDNLHRDDIRFFICFNPWDESTRKEDPFQGIASIIDGTDADGVVLDCSGNSNERLQQIADSIKPGVIMYSEGMAVVKDMPGIV